ncbi:hypothetical protein JTB14_001141 [Gonioctena quinquepunctata]|nr:hypothetical protein JTB14_001141 [Gonioctena quinquepunctata]
MESSDEVQGNMVNMVEEGESLHIEGYEDHSSSENAFDSDREERRYPLRERKPKDFSNFKLYQYYISSSYKKPEKKQDKHSKDKVLLTALGCQTNQQSSGASTHMIHHKERLVNYTNQSNNSLFANNQTLYSEGIGDVPVKLKSDSRIEMISGVTYVPHLASELLSKLMPKQQTTKIQNIPIIILALYVDDCFLFYNDQHGIEKVIKELSSHFRIKDSGETSHCLGMKIAHNKEKGQVTLSQRQYVIDLLNKFGMQDCNPVGTPLDTYVRFENNLQNLIENVPYQQVIGCLMYLCVMTRPDISFACSYLSQFNTKYSAEHWQAVKHVLGISKVLQIWESFTLRAGKMN